MFGCSKIKYVKPSPVTYHLSSVTCLILQPWLGLGTWFFWHCMMMWLDCMGYWSNKMSLDGFPSHVTCHMSALCIFTLRFSWQASVCYGGIAGSLHVGWACLLAILPHVSWQGIFWLRHDWDSWHEVSHVDMFQVLGWDSWHWLRHVVSHVLVRGCHQSHGQWKGIPWARHAVRSSRQLGWNRNFTHSLLVSLITICGFYIMPLTPQLPITLYSLKASTCSIQSRYYLLSSVITCSKLSWMMEVMMILEQRLRSSTQATA